MYVEEKSILDATHGGLDIIVYYYPQARQALETREKRFKIRDGILKASWRWELASNRFWR